MGKYVLASVLNLTCVNLLLLCLYLKYVIFQGTLAQAIKKGEWILLDEINLAAPETLECLSGLLEGSSGSLVLLDRGDTGNI